MLLHATAVVTGLAALVLLDTSPFAAATVVAADLVVRYAGGASGGVLRSVSQLARLTWVGLVVVAVLLAAARNQQDEQLRLARLRVRIDETTHLSFAEALAVSGALLLVLAVAPELTRAVALVQRTRSLVHGVYVVLAIATSTVVAAQPVLQAALVDWHGRLDHRYRVAVSLQELEPVRARAAKQFEQQASTLSPAQVQQLVDAAVSLSRSAARPGTDGIVPPRGELVHVSVGGVPTSTGTLTAEQRTTERAEAAAEPARRRAEARRAEAANALALVLDRLREPLARIAPPAVEELAGQGIDIVSDRLVAGVARLANAELVTRLRAAIHDRGRGDFGGRRPDERLRELPR